VVAVLLVVVGPDRTDHDQQQLLPPGPNGKPEAATAVYKLLMMGMRMPETCWTIFKRQAINLRNCCIWLIDSFKCIMMHGLSNPQFKTLECSLTRRIFGPFYMHDAGSICRFYTVASDDVWLFYVIGFVTVYFMSGLISTYFTETCHLENCDRFLFDKL
jgi:hypothetical protein